MLCTMNEISALVVQSEMFGMRIAVTSVKKVIIGNGHCQIGPFVFFAKENPGDQWLALEMCFKSKLKDGLLHS